MPADRLGHLPDDQCGEAAGDDVQAEPAEVVLRQLVQGAAAGDLSLAVAEHQLEGEPGHEQVHDPVADQPDPHTDVERVVVIHGGKVPGRGCRLTVRCG